MHLNAAAIALPRPRGPLLLRPRRRSDEWRQSPTTSAVRHLGASWDDFSDPQSNISSYYVQFFGLAPADGAGASVDAAAAAAAAEESGRAPARREVNLTGLVNVGVANRWAFDLAGWRSK